MFQEGDLAIIIGGVGLGQIVRLLYCPLGNELDGRYRGSDVRFIWLEGEAWAVHLKHGLPWVVESLGSPVAWPDSAGVLKAFHEFIKGSLQLKKLDDLNKPEEELVKQLENV